jgi:hypothetical protein
MSYIVYAAGITREGNAYGVDSMVGPSPSDRASCEKLAAKIQAEHPSATVRVVGFGEYLTTANQFVVRETGIYEGKANTLQVFGPFDTRAHAEGAVTLLKPGGGHEDMKDASYEIVEVTPAELAGMHVEGLPE